MCRVGCIEWCVVVYGVRWCVVVCVEWDVLCMVWVVTAHFASALDCTYSNHMTLGMRERSLSSSQSATRFRTSQGKRGVNTNYEYNEMGRA